MERHLDIRTGEHVAIAFDLAGVGSRFLAMAIDLGIQCSVAFAVVIGIGIAAAPIGRAIAALHLNRSLAGSLAIAVLAISLFVLFFGYFILFEIWWNGRSPGKRALGLRVIRDGGLPIDPFSSVVRNLVRTLEFSLGFYVFSACAMLISPTNKRLGDLAAGTLVIIDRPTEVLATFAREALERKSALGDLSGETWDRVAAYVARRATLEPQARTRLARGLASDIRPQLRAAFDHLDDDELLRHVARSATANDARG